MNTNHSDFQSEGTQTAFRTTSENDTFFSLSRFLKLLKLEIHLSIASWWVAILAILGVVFAITVIRLLAEQTNCWIETLQGTGTAVFLVTGFVFTSRAFNVLSSPAHSMQYLMLPASLFEKFFSKWLLSFVLFVLLWVSSLILLSGLLSVIAVAVFQGDMQLFNPFSIDFGRALLFFTVFHSLFFLGAVYFKRNQFFKTLLSMFVVNMVLMSWILLWTLIIIRPDSIDGVPYMLGVDDMMVYHVEHWLKAGLMIFWSLLSVFLLFVSYLRLKEREV